MTQDDTAPVIGSAKCDVAAADTGSGRRALRIESDKCDWQVMAPAVEARGSSLTAADDVRADFVAGRLRMESDKCDWSLRVADDAQRVVRVESSLADLEVRSDAGAIRGEMRSSKCDWSIQMSGAWPGMNRPPRVRAEMTSAKCDFALRIEVGLVGGASVNLRAAGSDKCDFRLVELPERPAEG